MKIIRWLSDNILFLFTLFLLAFIPLYPKIPLIDIKNTWVYVRVEDFLVVFVVLIWVVLLLLKKITLKTPLTLPVMLFWIIGALATIHGVLLIFPTISDAHPNVALLSFLRRIEYTSLFFVAYASVKSKRLLPYVVAILTLTLLCVVGYGFGQKFLGFKAYLTMNEEAAKGVGVQLSSLARVPSTFAGHYDLAAYLVLIIPLLTSMVFGFKNWLVKLVLLGSIGLGFVLLFMTVSRTSIFVLLIALGVLLFFYKKKLFFLSLLILPVMGLFMFLFTPNLLDRFNSTVKEVNVLVDAKTGTPLGHITEVPVENFKNKVIKVKYSANSSLFQRNVAATDSAVQATASAYLYPIQLPPMVPLLVESNAPTGENLPQGSGYINLTLSPVTKKIPLYIFQATEREGSESGQLQGIYGDFLIKRALAYDLSFTTRFQAEWPNAINAFKRNIFLGSGYGSTSLAVDNNYFRILGEVGLLGTGAFFAIFLFAGVYIKKMLPQVDSPIVRHFVLGFAAGAFGIALNAILIDVFEASKIAFLLWMLMGITIGTLRLYQKQDVHLFKEVIKALTSTYAIVLYIFLTAIILYSSVAKNFFTGDDFTWLRWVSDCSAGACQSFGERITEYFTQANGFFYRPGTKIYFSLIHSVFWLNPTIYHIVSILLHSLIAVLFFLLAKKVFRDALLAALSAFLFLVISGYSEAVFWISSTGFLFNALFILLSLLLYITWREKRNSVFFLLTILSIMMGLLFHELGVVAPLFIILYDAIFDETFSLRKIGKRLYYLLLFLPIVGYLIMRFLAQSHWLSGDYNYNLLKLPFNVVGNMFGYLSLTLLGPQAGSIFQQLRMALKENIIVSFIAVILVVIVLGVFYKMIFVKMIKKERQIILFGFLFFIISLLPFLGLGNLTSRYSYLSSLGIVILIVFCGKKLFGYLQNNGRDIATVCIVIIVSTFALFHLIQSQKVSIEWREAGEKTQHFITSIESLYIDQWKTDPTQFYFVDVPIKNGEAWVFPVGLTDALWLTFRNQNLTVHSMNSFKEAFDASQSDVTAKVFLFDREGRVKEALRIKDKIIFPADIGTPQQ